MTLMPVARHREKVLGSVQPLPAGTVPLAAAHGLRLAADVRSRLSVPPWDNSAMDGYAVRYEDIAAAGQEPVTLDVVADLPAGSALDPPLQPGQAARIMTGAVLPSSADTVVQLEHTDRNEPHGELPGTVTVLKEQQPGGHVRYAGEDLRPGDLVATGGAVADATVLAALAATGHDAVWVHRRARVAVIATGSELQSPGAELARGQIPDSNSLLLSALVRQAGGEVSAAVTVGDDPDDLRRRLAEVTPEADMIVLTGGVSAGAYDPLTRVFADSADVSFSSVSMQPGKPQAFGRHRQAVLFGLPGNPVSAWVSFHVFVRPALMVMHGADPSTVVPNPVPARAVRGWRTPPVRDQYLPARIGIDADGQYTVEPAATKGSKSHLVASLGRANGYAIVPGDVDQVAGGDVVHVVIDEQGAL